jgi:uncharacterized protein YfaQ (DUF2300 family)
MATVVVAAEQGKRPDVNFVHWTALRAGWYRAKIAAAGVAVAVDPGAAVARARELFLQRRPPLVDAAHDPVAELAQAFKLYSYGFLMRVVPAGAPAPSSARSCATTRRCSRASTSTTRDRACTKIHAAATNQRYERTWRTLA